MTLQDFLVSLLMIYFVRFMVLVCVLVSSIKVCSCAVIPFCLIRFVDLPVREVYHLSVSFKKSSVNLNYAGSAK